MAIFLQLIYRFKTIPTKMLVGFFVETDKLILKFMWKFKSPRELTLLNFKIYYKTTIVKRVWCWHKDSCRSIEK